jgi:hypothetical protein
MITWPRSILAHTCLDTVCYHPVQKNCCLEMWGSGVTPGQYATYG